MLKSDVLKIKLNTMFNFIFDVRYVLNFFN